MAEAAATPARTVAPPRNAWSACSSSVGRSPSRSACTAAAHDPTLEQPYTLFFTGTIQLKVWFATAAVALAVVQVLLGLRLFDKISVPRHAPSWLGDAHRLVGTIAFLLTLPVAYQCLWALGFSS